MAIMIKLSDKYTANNQKRIGTLVVTRKWQKIEPELMIIAEKFDSKGNVYELKKSVSDKIVNPKPEKIPITEESIRDNKGNIQETIKDAVKPETENVEDVEHLVGVGDAEEVKPNKPKKRKFKKRK